MCNYYESLLICFQNVGGIRVCVYFKTEEIKQRSIPVIYCQFGSHCWTLLISHCGALWLLLSSGFVENTWYSSRLHGSYCFLWDASALANPGLALSQEINKKRPCTKSPWARRKNSRFSQVLSLAQPPTAPQQCACSVLSLTSPITCCCCYSRDLRQPVPAQCPRCPRREPWSSTRTSSKSCTRSARNLQTVPAPSSSETSFTQH